MKKENLITGRFGEALAARYLSKKGYKILGQNYRTKYAEIDLIARHRGVLVFVEVRTKKGERFGMPEESLTVRKINKLINNAKAYVAWKDYKGRYRIDAVCVVLDEGNAPMRITHYENLTL